MKRQLLLLIAITLSLNAFAQVVVNDASINAGETFTMTSDNEYLLDGYVYVEEGATLVIEPGTVIKGSIVPTNGDLTSALIIARGGTILAEGTATEPIIFTGQVDDLSTTTDLFAFDNQTWGGIIILGNSIVGEDGGTDVIEGIPSDEPRIAYGGNDPNDNSGILRYVSIRHGGSVLGADNEINGLTLGGVGAGTTIDYIEIFANKDDGIEIFGGTVNITHAVVSFVGDDAYDVDESWDGYIQHMFSITGDFDGDHAIEYDGSEAADGTPFTTGRFYNGTFIGAGNPSTNTASDGLRLRNQGGLQIWNSIFTEIPGYVYRFDDDPPFSETAIAGNIAFDFGSDFTIGTPPPTFLVDQVDPDLAGISHIPDGGLDPRPFSSASAAASGALETPAEAENTVHRGAFAPGPDGNWARGWTAMDAYGYFGDIASSTVDFGVADNGLKLNVPAPNPVSTNFANITFELPERSEIQLTVFDISGKVINQFNLGEQINGLNNYQLNVANYSNGTYFLLLTSEIGNVSQKFSVNK